MAAFRGVGAGRGQRGWCSAAKSITPSRSACQPERLHICRRRLPAAQVVAIVAIGVEDVVDQPVRQQALDAKRQIDAIVLAALDLAPQLAEVFKETLVL